MSDQTALRFPDLIHNIINISQRPILLHQNKNTSTHVTYDINFPKTYPHSRVAKYNTPEEVAELVKDADLVYIEEAVSGFRRLVYSLEKLIKENKKIADVFAGKIILVETGADPVFLNELSELYLKLKNIFKTGPDIAVTYGLTETQDVSVYVFSQRDSATRYRVFDNKFVEVLDLKTGEPLIGSLGEIVITPLWWEKGTILPRYRTGDIGALEFFDNIPYLTISGRLPGSGVISFTGFKVSIPGICKILREQFEYPFRLQAQVKEKQDGSSGTLVIKLYSPCFSDLSVSEQVKTFLKNFIIKEYGLEFDIGQGYRRLEIITSTDDVGDKYWSILPKEIVD
ncbi:MAG TPA: hypothetical protein VMW04_00005, partial [Patescibacteria group bacterium]|nr:hypothetical protein [Patescibacteria group bacterium]